MVRAGREASGAWYLGRGTGRGIWWCRENECGKALGRGHVARALRMAVSEGDAAAVQALARGSGFKAYEL